MSYITIYFEDKPVFLCDEITPVIDEYRHHPDAVFIDELSTAAINSLLHEIRKPQFHAGIIYDRHFGHLKSAFFKHFQLVLAAGGLVLNEKRELLMIFRRGKWDLPKGKLDEGETIENCAMREVQEETGLRNLRIVRPLTTTYHTYDQFGKHNLKESHWYLMETKEPNNLVPQTEEEITGIKWVRPEDLHRCLENTFATIESVIKVAGVLP